MGRAPAVALAYMWWVQGKHLEDANANLVSKRWCAPALWAIRQAAADILYGGSAKDVTIRKKGTSNSKVVEIAGTCPSIRPNLLKLQSLLRNANWAAEAEALT